MQSYNYKWLIVIITEKILVLNKNSSKEKNE